MSVKLILMTGVVACALPLWAKVDRKSPAEPVRLIIDTDMYTDNDSGSLALAHALADRGECEILGVIASIIDELLTHAPKKGLAAAD